MLYCVDTSAWIDAVQRYNPASPLFKEFWDFLEKKIAAGCVISPEEVHVELKGKTLEENTPKAKRPKDALAFAETIKRVGHVLFVPTDLALQAQCTLVLTSHSELTTKGKPLAKSDGDAWVVALAQLRGATVVSQENPRPSKNPRQTIPDVCSDEGLLHIDLATFINQLQGL